jgi:hypothetical protein
MGLWAVQDSGGCCLYDACRYDSLIEFMSVTFCIYDWRLGSIGLAAYIFCLTNDNNLYHEDLVHRKDR